MGVIQGCAHLPQIKPRPSVTTTAGGGITPDPSDRANSPILCTVTPFRADRCALETHPIGGPSVEAYSAVFADNNPDCRDLQKKIAPWTSGQREREKPDNEPRRFSPTCSAQTRHGGERAVGCAHAPGERGGGVLICLLSPLSPG